jgi:hypothetical protein
MNLTTRHLTFAAEHLQRPNEAQEHADRTAPRTSLSRYTQAWHGFTRWFFYVPPGATV